MPDVSVADKTNSIECVDFTPPREIQRLATSHESGQNYGESMAKFDRLSLNSLHCDHRPNNCGSIENRQASHFGENSSGMLKFQENERAIVMKPAFLASDLFDSLLFQDQFDFRNDILEIVTSADIPEDLPTINIGIGSQMASFVQGAAPTFGSNGLFRTGEDYGVTAIEWNTETSSAKGGTRGKPADEPTDDGGSSDGGGGGGGNGGGGGRGKPKPDDGGDTPTDPVTLTDGYGFTLPAGASDPTGLMYFSDNGAERVDSLQDSLSGFDIAISFLGDWSSDLANTWYEALTRSADFFTSFISEGLYVDEGSFADSAITDGSGSWWDDLLIEVSFDDLQPGALASAGPSAFWPTNADGDDIPAKGSMTIDTDIQDMSLENATLIATHEMMHVLGVGTIWGTSSIFQPYNHDLVASDGTYLGSAANAVYAQEFEADSGGVLAPLTVENDGGSGTAGGHWETDLAVNAVNLPGDENGIYTDDFAYELMTGWIDLSNPQTAYLSDTSLAVLEDLGYTVDWNVDYQYDDYNFV